MLKPLNINLDKYITIKGDYNFSKLLKDFCNGTCSNIHNISISIQSIVKLKDIIENSYIYNFQCNLNKYEHDNEGNIKLNSPNNYYNSIFICKDLKLILHVYSEPFNLNDPFYCYIYFDNNYSFNKDYTKKIDNFFKFLNFVELKKKKKVSGINVITIDFNKELNLYYKELTDINISIKDNYNDDIMIIYPTILERLNKSNDKGLILLYGKPGTGKTSFIRHLCKEITDKKIIYIPPDLANCIGDPSFLQFLIKNNNSILIIEDAENLIQARENGRSGTISNILNLSDGLLSDVLNIQLICTFNCPISNIDQALLRKGRIIAKYEFKELSLDKTKVLYSKATNPMILSDIYNKEEFSFNNEKKETKKIGFEYEN